MGDLSLYSWPPVGTGLELGAWQLTIYFYLQNIKIQTSQTGGQQHSDTSPFSIPRLRHPTLKGAFTLAIFARDFALSLHILLTKIIFFHY